MSMEELLMSSIDPNSTAERLTSLAAYGLFIDQLINKSEYIILYWCAHARPT